MLLRHFYIWGNYYGSAPERQRFVHGILQDPQHYAMFCPECGEIWARMPVDGVHTSNWWRIIGGNCERHPGPSRFVVAGSLMMEWEKELQEILPDGVIRREFELHMELLNE